MSVEALEVELAQARAAHEAAEYGRVDFAPWVVALMAQRVTELELRLQYARDPEAHQPTATVKREPKESPEDRRARIRASRERRLREAQARVDSYENTHPVNEYGVRTGPSVAGNNWRHRQAGVDRDVTAWHAYQQDIKTIRHLTGLLKED